MNEKDLDYLVAVAARKQYFDDLYSLLTNNRPLWLGEEERTALNKCVQKTVIVKASQKQITINFGHPDYVTKTTVKKMNEASEEYGLGFHVSVKKGLVTVNVNGNSHLKFMPSTGCVSVSWER